MEFSQLTFLALGSEVEVTVMLPPGPKVDQLWQRLRLCITEFEKRFSRFDPKSELSQFNRSSSLTFSASPEFARLLKTAQKYYHRTGGIFDPTIHDTLHTFYDKSFDQLKDDKTAFLTPPHLLKSQLSLANVKVNSNNLTVTRTKGLHLDFGGIGKGYLVDQCAKLISKVTDNFWFGIGGDFMLSRTADQKPWQLNVQHPLDLNRDMMTLTVKPLKLAIATSGITKRAGIKNGVGWHHLIDPRTHAPVKNSLLSVTAFAPSATMADVIAKTVLILGEEAGLKFMAQNPNCGCIMVTRDLQICASDNIKRWVEYADSIY